MFDDLDRALRALLVQEVADLAEDRVHFEPPDAEFRPSIPAVDLFLYDVRENRELRDNDWQLDRQQNGDVVKRRAPRRIDCSYLVTAWAGDALSEHLLLGAVTHALLRHPVIEGDLVQGQLAGQVLPAGALHPALLQAIGEFWQAMGNKPRAALNFTVTVAADVFAPVSTSVVQTPVVIINQKTDTKES